MKFKWNKMLVFPFIIFVYVLLHFIVPTEKEYEKNKMKHINERNFIEKKLVGKWNLDSHQSVYNNRYHLFSADGSYTYHGSDNSKIYSGNWYVNVNDSILYIKRKDTINNSIYKLKEIQSNMLVLEKKGKYVEFMNWTRYK